MILAGALVTGPASSQSISDLLKGYFAYNRFWGNILVVQHDKILFQGSYGFSDKNLSQKNDEESLFGLASVTKTITAAAIFKLHDEGKLSIYDRVDKYIPGFATGQSDNVTIINLLNHTSGMAANLAQFDDFSKGGNAAHGGGSSHGGEASAKKEVSREASIISLEDLIDANRSSGFKNRPGEKYEYNNYGYLLLAYIIEKVSGMDYLTYLNKTIFAEADMRNTFDRRNLSGEPALGYFGIGTVNIYPAPVEPAPLWLKGATGLFSTTTDLENFIKSVFSCMLFSRETLHLMLDTCVNTGRGNVRWTAGFQKQEIEGHVFYSHGGSTVGYSTLVGYMPDDDISIIILSNLVRDFLKEGQTSVDFSFVGEIADDVLKILHGVAVSYLPLPEGKASKKLEGDYRLDDTHYLTISYSNDSLKLKTRGGDSSFTLFDYNLYREVKDTSDNYKVCKEFISLFLANKLNGFGKYATDELKGVFDEHSVEGMQNFWEGVQSHYGNYKSSNVYEKTLMQGWADYLLSFHLENAEIIMRISFNTAGMINGFYILKLLPKCNIYEVNLIPTDRDQYFVNGYSYGGFNDFRIGYDPQKRTMSFSNGNDNFEALRYE